MNMDIFFDIIQENPKSLVVAMFIELYTIFKYMNISFSLIGISGKVEGEQARGDRGIGQIVGRASALRASVNTIWKYLKLCD